MKNLRSGIVILLVVCIIFTGVGFYLIGGIEPENLKIWLEQMGLWAPVFYILIYTVATILVLPSTPLNLCGGALFGIWFGTLWTTVAAIIAGVVAFYFARTIGRDLISSKLAGRWQAIDAEMRQGGLFYMFAIRLLPIIPYGLVNFAAGLTSIKFRDYFLGSVVGTLPGVFPFVMIGSGLTAMTQGDIFPLMFGFLLSGILVGFATWYRRRRKDPYQNLTKK